MTGVLIVPFIRGISRGMRARLKLDRLLKISRSVWILPEGSIQNFEVDVTAHRGQIAGEDPLAIPPVSLAGDDDPL